MASSRIAELAIMISIRTKELDEYIIKENLPFPSFNVDAPIQLTLSESATVAQEAILDATTELRALLLGPIGILQYVCEHNTLTSLHAINRFKMAESFPVGEEATFAQISNKYGLKESDTRRIIRHCVTYYIFKEPQNGLGAHTAASKALVEVPKISQWVGMVSEEMWPSATRVVDAMIKWPNSEEPNQAGYNLAKNSDSPIYMDLDKTPDRARRFADAMSLFSSDEGFQPSHLAENYNWSTVRTVVDVGGSHGPVSIELARRFPQIRCIVQDRPETAAEGRLRIPPELSDRITFMAHDFFTEQPVKGADVYYFRWIFHDWSDKYSIQILKNLIPALKHGAKIIVSEFCLPEPGMLSMFQEKPLRCFDLAMMELTNARERGGLDWAALFQAADSRFVFNGVTVPRGSKLAIIEASWNGQ